MSPAFSSTRQAAGFALLLLTVLLLPVIAGKSILPPREQSYASMSWENGPFPYVREQVFVETGDIDIAFVGSSHLLHGIDTPYLQEQLSRKLGRPAVVRTIAWGGAGFDALYLITQDLLSHRRVRLLVFYDEYLSANRNSMAVYWFRYGDDAEVLAGLPVQVQATFYLASIMGMPRNLLCRVRPNIPADLTSAQKNFQETEYCAPNPATRLGSMSAELAFDPDYRIHNPNFVAFTPATGASPADACVYSAATQSKFEFQKVPIPEWQLKFGRRFAALAEKQGTRLVLLHMPTLDEMRSPVIREQIFWPDALRAAVTMAGIPPATMMAGLSDDDVHKLFFNPTHLNRNGLEYFTRLITPCLLQLYESSNQH